MFGNVSIFLFFFLQKISIFLAKVVLFFSAAILELRYRFFSFVFSF